MTRHFLLALALAALLPGAALAQRVPATPSPATRDAEFSLQTSIFDRFRGQTTRPVDSASTTRSAPMPAPRFVGAIRFDTGFTGFVEIVSASQVSVTPVHVGDILPWEHSRILGISLDALHLTGDRGSRIIPMGYDFNNQPVQVRTPGVPTPAPRDFRSPRRSPLFQPAPTDLRLVPGTPNRTAAPMRERRLIPQSGAGI
jgi:hypothetical protein